MYEYRTTFSNELGVFGFHSTEHECHTNKYEENYKEDNIVINSNAKILGGGFHCVTLDLNRKGTLEQYDF